MQWPDHCRQASFGGRFSPFLKIPKDARVIKKGWDQSLDTYSAFGGTLSKQPYPFDTQDTEDDLKGRPSLADLLAHDNIERLWVVGLATDYCVGGSALDALGANNATGRAAPPGLTTVVLVAAATRAVDPATTGPAMVAAIRAAGGKIPRSAEPAAAIAEVCGAS